MVLARSRRSAPQEADDPPSQKARSHGQVGRLDRRILANDAEPMHGGDHTTEQVGIFGERRDALRQLLPQSLRLGLFALGVRLRLLGLALLRLPARLASSRPAPRVTSMRLQRCTWSSAWCWRGWRRGARRVEVVETQPRGFVEDAASAIGIALLQRFRLGDQILETPVFWPKVSSASQVFVRIGFGVTCFDVFLNASASPRPRAPPASRQALHRDQRHCRAPTATRRSCSSRSRRTAAARASASGDKAGGLRDCPTALQ